jgi:hypothetical protein
VTSTPQGVLPLKVVDGRRLEKGFRDVLDPDGLMADLAGRAQRLPRWFYEVPSWEFSVETALTPHFDLWEFIHTDVREAEILRSFPRYVPCAITILALCLERYRDAVGTYVHISANGGYRSPRHALARFATPHCWGTAVNIYRIGDSFLDNEQAITRYAGVARDVLTGAYVKPYEEADDHLHIDLGYVLCTPRDAEVESYNPKLDWEPL